MSHGIYTEFLSVLMVHPKSVDLAEAVSYLVSGTEILTSDKIVLWVKVSCPKFFSFVSLFIQV